MNKQQLKTQCNSENLELFLRGTLSSSETEILELHLTECESCARQIQLAAEQGVSWHEAQSLLAADEYDSPQHFAAISSLLSDEHDPMTKHQTADVVSREIRGWLDPTDDPRSMGRFAGYEIVGIVGHGGMGIVLKGFEASLNRYVAIKILAPRLATNGSARKRFAREAQAAAAVRHDNVIAIHRVDEWHSLPFLVMPYAGGISLQKRIDSEGPLSIEQTLRVGVQIASGLAAAHAQGLIHRDIKPANILLEQGVERVTITDFGLARAADDASVTRTGVVAGTPQYMSPEQAEAKQLDARSDLFSLGSVLYAMATGRPPFRGAGSFEVLKRIVHEPARPMREIEASVPDWFENIVNRLHSKSPNDRPSAASEVAELLEECLAHVQQPTTTPLPESIATLAPKQSRRLPIGKFIAAAAFAFSLIFAGVLIVLELNKGTLTIASEADDVPIRIMQGERVVEKLEVSKLGKTVRVAAGNYVVEIDGDIDGIAVHGGEVLLERSGVQTVKIVATDAASEPANGKKSVGESTDPHLSLSPLGLRLAKQLRDARLQRESLSRIYGSRHPRILEQDSKIKSIWEASLAEARAQAKDSGDRTSDNRLLDAIIEFNAKLQRTCPNHDQPPLTQEELVACASWKLEFEQDRSDAMTTGLKFIAQEHRLPEGWSIEGGYVELPPKLTPVQGFQIFLQRDQSSERLTIRERFLVPPKDYAKSDEKIEPLNGIPLAAAIRRFNIRHSRADGEKQPPITEDEVVAAIINWKTKVDEADISDKLFSRFQQIAHTRYLPDESEFELISRFGSERDSEYTICSIRIKMPQDEKGREGWTYAFEIRKQFISVKHGVSDSIHWGLPGANGLQAGVRLSPPLLSYRTGQKIAVEFFYRNILGKPMSGVLPNFFTYNEIEVYDAEGVKLEVITPPSEIIGGWMEEHFDDNPVSRRSRPLVLAPMTTPTEQVATTISGSEDSTLIFVKPGQSCTLQFTVGNYADGSKDLLKTGKVEFKVEEANEKQSRDTPTTIRIQSDASSHQFEDVMKGLLEKCLLKLPSASKADTSDTVIVRRAHDSSDANTDIDATETEVSPSRNRVWQQTEPYIAPNFNTFFPDSKDGGQTLDDLWNAADKESRSDAEILKAVREGFRNTRQHRMPILRWIGNKYIWNKSPQNPDAIEIMYHAADFSGENANSSGARHAAVYFGLSVTQPKTPAILRTLAELSMRVDDPNDLDRIAWGCSSQKEELLEYLKPFHESDDGAVRNKADVCRRIFTGELKAFAWAAEQARQRAEKAYSSQLPQFKEALTSGSSDERLKSLQTILVQRIALIMDDSFVAAFAKCAEDKDRQVRVQTTIIAGANWVWEAQEQNPEAIQLMLKLSKDDVRDVRYNAVYYGLSTVRNKSDDVIRRLLEMAFEDREWNLFNRIEWGLRDDRDRVATMLTEYINEENEAHSNAAREVFKQLTGREVP